MLRRKPTKIELKLEDKEELEQARQRAATITTSTTSTAPKISPPKCIASASLPIEMSHIHKALMEDKIKLKLPDVAAHGQATLLAPFHLGTHHQENLFFNDSSSPPTPILRPKFSLRGWCWLTLTTESRRTRRS